MLMFLKVWLKARWQRFLSICPDKIILILFVSLWLLMVVTLFMLLVSVVLPFIFSVLPHEVVSEVVTSLVVEELPMDFDDYDQTSPDY